MYMSPFAAYDDIDFIQVFIMKRCMQLMIIFPPGTLFLTVVSSDLDRNIPSDIFEFNMIYLPPCFHGG